jgi:predicted ATPase
VLAKLVEAEVLYQRGLPPQTHYLFKHALIQDAAYQSLLKSTRQQYHTKIAQVLADRFPETVETQPELLAHHYTEAGLIAQAIPYWQQAGEGAVRRSANVEAVAHLTRGLELLKTLPDTPERAQQELTLQLALAMPLGITKGHAAPEMGTVFTRAIELCRQVGETPQLWPALLGAYSFYLWRAEYQTARELGERLISLAQRVQDSTLLLTAHFVVGQVFVVSGEWISARAHFEQALALYNPGQRRAVIARAGRDGGVASLPQLANVLWALGYPDQALTRSRAALTLVQEIAHPLTTVLVWLVDTWLHRCLHEVRTVQQRAEAMIALCNEQGFSAFLALAIVWRGWALAMQRQEEEGIQQIHQGLAALRATGAELFRPYFLGLLAEAYGKAGQVEEGLTALAEALAAVDRTGERMYEAELYRLKGELTLQQFGVRGSEFGVTNPQSLTPNPQSEAEACFLKAIEIARKQQAKSLELRATVNLARLWQRQGKHHAARNTLSEIYSWFTEGFDTKALQEAKALLEELG